MVGELRSPLRPWIPTEVGRPSVKARAGSWQVAQATVPSADRRPSKNSFWPRAIFSGVCGLSGGVTARVGSTGSPTCCRDLGLARGPALGSGGAFPGACPAVPASSVSSAERSFGCPPAQPSRSAALIPATATTRPKRARFRIDMALRSFLPAGSVGPAVSPQKRKSGNEMRSRIRSKSKTSCRRNWGSSSGSVILLFILLLIVFQILIFLLLFSLLLWDLLVRAMIWEHQEQRPCATGPPSHRVGLLPRPLLRLIGDTPTQRPCRKGGEIPRALALAGDAVAALSRLALRASRRYLAAVPSRKARV